MDARLRGQADYRNGKLLRHNPYRSIKQGKRAWIKGWHEGREAAELFAPASGIEAEGRDRADGHGAKHESPTGEAGDAQ